MKNCLKNQSELSMPSGSILSIMRGKKMIFSYFIFSSLKTFSIMFKYITKYLIFRLPIILGENYMKSFGLFPLTEGFSNNYRNDFDPRITNAFATAGFRMGHSLIPEMIKYIYLNLVNKNSNIRKIEIMQVTYTYTFISCG